MGPSNGPYGGYATRRNQENHHSIRHPRSSPSVWSPRFRPPRILYSASGASVPRGSSRRPCVAQLGLCTANEFSFRSQGNLYFRQGDLAAAQGAYEHALALGESAELYRNLALTQLMTGSSKQMEQQPSNATGGGVPVTSKTWLSRSPPCYCHAVTRTARTAPSDCAAWASTTDARCAVHHCLPVPKILASALLVY